MGQALVQSRLELGGAVITSVVTKSRWKSLRYYQSIWMELSVSFVCEKRWRRRYSWYETEDGYKVSMRSNGGMDVARVAMSMAAAVISAQREFLWKEMQTRS